MMFEEDTSVFFSDFADDAIYTDGSFVEQLKAIVDFNVTLIGFEGEVAATATTFTTDSLPEIVIGGTFNYQENDYLVDGVVSDDKVIKVVSVVKQ